MSVTSTAGTFAELWNLGLYSMTPATLPAQILLLKYEFCATKVCKSWSPIVPVTVTF
jgi:hypothetical protein